MKRHALDVVSLAFGLAFTALGLILLNSSVEIGDLSTRWLAPGVAVLAGVVLAIAGASILREREAIEPSSATPDELTSDEVRQDGSV